MNNKNKNNKEKMWIILLSEAQRIVGVTAVANRDDHTDYGNEIHLSNKIISIHAAGI